MAETNIPPVPVNTPMLDGRGLLTQAWQRFMYALKQRAGGDNAPTNNDLLLNPMSTVGDTIYGGTAGVATRLPGNTAATQKFLAQTGSGTAAGAPVWVTLAVADIPNLSFSKITTGIVPFGQGGTGQSTQQTAMDALAGTQSSGKYLRSDGTHTTLSSIVAGDVPTLNQNTSGNAATATLATSATSATSATTATKPASGSAHGAVTLSGAGNFQSVAPGSSGNVLTSDGTDWVSQTPSSSSFTAPSVQRFTSGSGTYTKPAGVLYLRVRMVGGGGGGAGSGNTPTNGTAGGNTTFGTTLLVANGGGGGRTAGAAGAAGGTASLGTGPIGTAISGGNSTGGQPVTLANGISGTASPFGGAGAGGQGTGSAGSTGADAIANTGSGGGGAGSGNASGASGGGGGAGGYVDAIITSPSATYSYAVGASGAKGTLNGGNGSDGGAGGSGVIEVWEYRQ